MPQLTAPQIAKLQAENHQITPYLSFLKPRTLWTARVNNVPAAQGDISIPFDGGSGSAFGAVEAFQEVWVGTSAGANDLGYARIRGITSGDGGVTGTLSVAKSPTLWQDDAYLTFRHDYPLRPLRPRIATDETFYKDYDVAFNWPPTPVCVAGPHRAQFLTGASLVFAVNLSSSYAIASGATISSYAASVYPTTGVTVSVNSGTGIGTITFTQTGQYWAKFSCTDSNGKVQTTFRCYFVASTDPTHEDFPLVDFELSEMMGTYESGGWDAGFSVHNGPTLADIPDRTLAIMWGSWKYDDVFGPVAFGPNNDNSILVGYVRQDNYSKDMGTGEQPVRFKMSTAQGVMGQKYNFSISLEAVQGTPDAWWKYDNTLTVGKGIHHLLAEHSTVLECADVIGLTDVGTLRAYVEIPDNDIFGAGNALSSQRGSREHLVCDRYGRIYFKRNQQLLSDADRAGLTTVGEITTTDRSLLEVSREQEKQVCFTHVSGFVWNGTFDAEGAPDAQPVCAVAPGDDPEEDGPKVERVEYQTFASQNEANDVAGRVHSAANNPFKELEVTFHGNYLGVVEIANGEQWEISLLTTETPREIVLTNRKIYPRLVQISIIDGVATVTVTFESEAPPLAGKTTDCPTLPFIDGDWDLPDEDSLAGALVTAGSVKYKSPLGNSWSTRYSGAVSDMVADPYWQSKQNSDASSDAILVIGGVGYIRRSTDAGQTWSVVTPGTNPPNDFSDSPAPTAATVDYAIIEANEAVESEWLVAVRWQNSSNEWRSWLLYTDDDFATTSWKSGGGISQGPYTVSASETLQSPGGAVDGGRIISLNDTDFVVGYLRQMSPSGNWALYARIGRVGGGGVTFGSETLVGENQNCHTWSGCAMSSTVVLFSYNHTTGGTSNQARVFSCTINDLEFDTIGAKTNMTTSLGRHIRVAKITDTKAIFVAARKPTSTTAVTPGYYSRIINISGATITSTGTAFIARSADQIIGIDLFALSATAVFVAFGIRAGTSTSQFTVHAHILTISTDTITENSSDSASMAGSASASSMTCCLVGAKVLITAAMTNLTPEYYISGWVGVISGTSVTLSAESQIYAPGSTELLWPVSTTYSSTHAMMTFTSGPAPTSSTYTVKLLVNALNQVANLEEVIFSQSVALGNESLQGVVGGQVAVGYIEDDGTGSDGPLKMYIQIFGGLGKVLGLSIGRAEGLLAYITSWDEIGLALNLQIYELPTLDKIDQIALGSATESELNSRQKIAFPFAPWGFSDDFCWVFGRMEDPADLTGIQHVIYTLDAALSFTTLDDSFGASHCSSLIEAYGTVHALISTGSQSKLYVGSFADGLALKSTLPIPGFAWPHGQTFDWLEQIIYVGTGVAGAVAVVKSDFPYGEWQDITYDHGATAIKSIIIL